MLITLGRFEGYIGRLPRSPSRLQAACIRHGYGLWLGRWEIFICWLPKRKPQAQIRADLLALARERNAEWAKVQAARCWPARGAP